MPVRPIASSDGPALLSAFNRLSPETRHARFAGAKPRLTKGEVAYFVDIDHHDHEALIALDPDDGGIVAVARFASEASRAEAEVAIAVGDAWQGRGVGSALIEQLLERAEQEGVPQLTASVLADNTRSLRMLAHAGFEVSEQHWGMINMVRPVAGTHAEA
ncbi:MAG TPA: GNAT family N-acetyltransferase [Solirubrobacteraceae bacterium]|nr:GNAT family N-acetyltransferase [Solirubrobacteraceae bacterium]